MARAAWAGSSDVVRRCGFEASELRVKVGISSSFLGIVLRVSTKWYLIDIMSGVSTKWYFSNIMSCETALGRQRTLVPRDGESFSHFFMNRINFILGFHGPRHSKHRNQVFAEHHENRIHEYWKDRMIELGDTTIPQCDDHFCERYKASKTMRIWEHHDHEIIRFSAPSSPNKTQSWGKKTPKMRAC